MKPLPKFGKHAGIVFIICRSSASMPERFFAPAEVRQACRSSFSSLPKFGKHAGAAFRPCRSSASMPERFFVSAEVRQAVRRRPATIFGVRRVHIALTFRSCFLLSSSVKEGGVVRRGASSALPFFSASTDQRTVPWSITVPWSTRPMVYSCTGATVYVHVYLPPLSLRALRVTVKPSAARTLASVLVAGVSPLPGW